MQLQSEIWPVRRDAMEETAFIILLSKAEYQSFRSWFYLQNWFVLFGYKIHDTRLFHNIYVFYGQMQYS